MHVGNWDRADFSVRTMGFSCAERRELPFGLARINRIPEVKFDAQDSTHSFKL